MSFIENALVAKLEEWALERLNDRVTWATWISLAAAHFGGVVNPSLDPLLVNAATAFFAVVGYVVKGNPIFEGKASK